MPPTPDASDRRIPRIVVVGLGKLGLLHAATINALPDLSLVGVVEPSRYTAKLLDQYLTGVHVYPDLGSVPNGTRIDGVVIATPTGTHLDLIREALRRGWGVMVEKPMTLDSSQSRQILALPEPMRSRAMVGYMTRHVETFVRAADVLRAGVLGPPMVVRATMYVEQLLDRGEGWRYHPQSSGGGVLITQNSHLIDLMLWTLGRISRVNGRVASLVSDHVEDVAHAFLEFECGAVGFLDTSWSARHHRTATISLHVQGPNGTLDASDDEVRLFLDAERDAYPTGWTVWRRPDLAQTVPVDIGGPHYTKQMMAFRELLLGAAGAPCTLEAGHEVQCVVDAIYASHRSDGRAVTVAYDT